VRIVQMRRRIGRVRRLLAPHREAFAVLERPDMALHEDLGRPWPGLLARFEGTIDSVDRLRDALLGTYDIYMGRAAQRDSEVIESKLSVLAAVGQEPASSRRRSLDKVGIRATPARKVDGSPTWYGHPDPQIDVSVLPLTISRLQGMGIRTEWFRSDEHPMPVGLSESLVDGR
jgi:hypothetical protein